MNGQLLGRENGILTSFSNLILESIKDFAFLARVLPLCGIIEHISLKQCAHLPGCVPLQSFEG